MVDFTPKVWADGAAGNTPIRAADLNRLETAASALTTAVNGASPKAPLLLWAAKSPDSMVTGTITYNTSGAPTGHNVLWPDGATGVYAGVASTAFPDAIDRYTITHVLAGTTTTTYTQPAITRDSNGQVTNRPAVTVA